MVGTTSVEVREHIKTLSVTDGEFLIRCGRTGDQPVPVCGLRFEKRSTAQSAAHAARQYRTALRQYDPQLLTMTDCLSGNNRHTQTKTESMFAGRTPDDTDTF
jgi:hypothetical protein